jgi:methylenetetrahydrofolate dehydrogenase (NADP+) / methenyltetrahydrofolate cyclohydrolase
LTNHIIFYSITPMKSIDGRAMALQLRADMKEEILHLPSAPGLGVLLIGDDPASALYVSLKEKAAQEAGIHTDIKRLPASTSDDDIKKIIQAWNADATIDGILVQLPLPSGHNTDGIIETIDPKKDVDGFHPENIRAAEIGEGSILPPVHETILRLIAATGIDPRGKAATILANSEVFSAPLARVLQRAGFLTAIMDPDALDADVLKTSQVIVIAIGRAGFLRPDLVSPGAVIIDVGTNRGLDGKVCGDADAKSLADMDGWITPVPGGVGPMTVALLLKNVVRAAEREGRASS